MTYATKVFKFSFAVRCKFGFLVVTSLFLIVDINIAISDFVDADKFAFIDTIIGLNVSRF